MFQLNYRDSRPFYEQIKENLRRLMATHSIAENEKLPSVRELSSSLTINPYMVQKAYHDLEDEGYIYTIPGKGSFAAPAENLPDTCSPELLLQFDRVVSELFLLSVPPRELKERIQTIYDNRKELNL